MIIVEGPDGAGKTTLIAQIQDWFPHLEVAGRVVGKDTESMIPSLRGWVEDNVSQGFQELIFDRHRLISEPIYGTLLRRTFQDGFGDLSWLFWTNFTLMRSCEPIIIYCLPPLEVVHKNIRDDPDQPARVKKNIRKIWSLYANFAVRDMALSSGSSASVMVYDYTDSDIRFGTSLQGIIREIDRRIHNHRLETDRKY